ncbi:DNA-binding response regulator [Cryobacterium arcticum]|uniref:Two-component system, regulatory protein n=1 Tax=Cryobacterium arcticum TaxID=670052 RepID=A0A1B1BFX1_9MICO|nr:LuxR C-terminal-related transcriptional regulator [Cryobacterium arcticum]ANP71468.1 Two-component system, regulatory protein [Cryobacterium arcticum]
MTTRDDTPPIRLALLDDHELLLDSMGTWIAEHAPDFTLVLTSTSWADFVHRAEFPADLVLIDYQITEPVSIEARVRTCRAAGAKVIVISGLDTREARERARLAGAADYLAKDLPMAAIMDAARAVMRRVSAQRPFAPARPGSGAGPRPTSPSLSPGEATAFRLYAAGHSTKDVASEMAVQYETAKTYLRRVREKYAKVGRPASRKGDLIRRAAEDGYLH